MSCICLLEVYGVVGWLVVVFWDFFAFVFVCLGLVLVLILQLTSTEKKPKVLLLSDSSVKKKI